MHFDADVQSLNPLYCGNTQKELISIDYPLSIVNQIHHKILDRLIKMEFFPPENDTFNDVFVMKNR